jgi:hypothetical protein
MNAFISHFQTFIQFPRPLSRFFMQDALQFLKRLEAIDTIILGIHS